MSNEQRTQRFCLGGMFPLEGYSMQVKNLLHGNAQVYAFENLIFVIMDTNAHVDSAQFQKEENDEYFLYPLERIFKKSGESYSIKGANRYVLTLALKNDSVLLQKYREIHLPGKVWPQIIRNMEIMGILDMEIHLMGHQAFLVMETRPDFDLDVDAGTWASLPMEKEWQEYVSKCQQTGSNNASVVKWKKMNLLNQIK